MISAIGGILGVGLSLIYTRLIFAALNSVWIDIVRTDHMQMYISFPNLVTGFLLSTAGIMDYTLFTVRRFLEIKKKDSGKCFPVIMVKSGISWQLFQEVHQSD